ncbi:MAG: hypothetical protein PVF90_03110 [Gemmatimonadota bacterium]
MRNTMTSTASKVLAGVTTLLLSALPLSAQEGAMDLPDAVAHAEIGVVESIDFVSNTIRTAYPMSSGEEAVRTFKAGQTTLVEGRGGIHQFSELTSRAFGHVAVVEFVRDEDGGAFARRIQFPSTRTIRMTQGTIKSVDEANHQLTLATAAGTEELNVDMGYGATIDSKEGLLELDALQSGQRITVYFTDAQRDMDDTAYLIYKND